MHVYTITRGIKQDVDRFIRELSSQYIPFKGKFDPVTKQPIEDKGPLDNLMLQVAVRPIQLWEIVFPKTWQDVMLTTILGGRRIIKKQTKHQVYVSMLRKMLGVQKIPEFKIDKKLPIWTSNIERVGIGIKEDGYFPNGMERI